LIQGTYKVSISANTFATTNGEGVIIEANTERRFDAQLRPQSVGLTVTVTSAPPELQTDNATVANELESAQVQTLVTTAGFNMRNFQSLFLVLPGFSPPTEQHSESGNPADTMMFNTNGMSGSNNSTRIDGVSDIYPWLPEITAYTPSTEAISTVNVVTNSMNAEQGFASGAAVSVTTKSGTNQFRGSAWEYNMISALMAKSTFFVATPTNRGLIPKYVLNQFGGNYGGPILKNKAFFFGNWERTRRSQAFSGTQTVPSPAMIAGNFQGVTTLINNVPTPVLIYDPATGNPDGTGRTQFQYNGQSNVIPPNRISYAATQMIKLMTADAPNVAGANLLSLSAELPMTSLASLTASIRVTILIAASISTSPARARSSGAMAFRRQTSLIPRRWERQAAPPLTAASRAMLRALFNPSESAALIPSSPTCSWMPTLAFCARAWPPKTPTSGQIGERLTSTFPEPTAPAASAEECPASFSAASRIWAIKTDPIPSSSGITRTSPLPTSAG
jgi:hypothetical protein